MKIYSVGQAGNFIIISDRCTFFSTSLVTAFDTDNYWEAYAYALKMSKELDMPVEVYVK